MARGDEKRRSWLLVPASRTQEIAAAAKSEADVIVLDLVELVAEKDKPAARKTMRDAIEVTGKSGAEVFAQVSTECMSADLEAAAWPGLAGVVISRAESAEQVAEAAALLDCLEEERELARESIAIVAALETAKGNHDVYYVLRASPRVWAATLGRADLVMDLRPEPSGEIHLMPYLMQRLVIVAAAAGVKPLGAWWRAPDRGLLATPENTLEAARRGRAIGFKGAMCIRANQVDALNKAYSA